MDTYISEAKAFKEFSALCNAIANMPLKDGQVFSYNLYFHKLKDNYLNTYTIYMNLFFDIVLEDNTTIEACLRVSHTLNTSLISLKLYENNLKTDNKFVTNSKTRVINISVPENEESIEEFNVEFSKVVQMINNTCFNKRCINHSFASSRHEDCNKYPTDMGISKNARMGFLSDCIKDVLGMFNKQYDIKYVAAPNRYESSGIFIDRYSIEPYYNKTETPENYIEIQREYDKDGFYTSITIINTVIGKFIRITPDMVNTDKFSELFHSVILHCFDYSTFLLNTKE